MGLGVGIVGLPNAGKTTLFNALTRANALVARYAFSTVTPNTAMVTVPDARLPALAAIYRPKKVTPASMRMVDVAGLVKGASRGEGMGNLFLSHLRDADALVMVVRLFDDPNVPYAGSSHDPLADMETVTLELILADLELVLRRREKIASTARVKPDSPEREELRVLDRLHAHLDAGQPARRLALDATDAELVRHLPLLTAKPVLYVANIGERDIGKDLLALEALRRRAHEEEAEFVVVSARLEAEVAELPDADAGAFLRDAGLPEPALGPFVREAYRLLRLVTFFTGNDNELRAWPVPSGMRAPAAAGAVHTDFQRGFIRAEVIAASDLVAAGSISAARERGAIRLEGREYVVNDGDVLLFRSNV